MAFNSLYRPPTVLSLLDNKCPAGTNWGSQRRETLLGSVIFSSHFFVQAQKSREGRESAFLAKPRWGFDRFRAWKRRIVRAVS